MSLHDIHRKLYGTPPSESQRAFYESGARGFDFKHNDEALAMLQFRAVFVLAVHEALRGPVVIAIPKPMEREVLQLMKDTSRLVFRRFRGLETKVKSLAEAIKRMQLAPRLLQDEPNRWVAIGLSKDDPIPEWLKNRLWTTMN